MVTLQSYHTLAKVPVMRPPVMSPTVPDVKTETFASVMASFSKTIADAIQQGHCPHISGPTASASRNTDCNFCRGPHFIHDCSVVNDYVVAGKCRRNHEGKVVLSTGAFYPQEIPGTLLREWIDEWHHRNPNQLSAASLIHMISAGHIWASTAGTIMPTFQLSTADRITTLEAELFSLRSRCPSFTPVVKTRAQHA